MTLLLPVAEFSIRAEISHSSLANRCAAAPATLDFLDRFTRAELERFTDYTEVMESEPA